MSVATTAAGLTNWKPLPGTFCGIAFLPSRCYPVSMTTLSIKLPESLAERITRAAAEEGISRSEYLRKAALDRLKPRPRNKGKKPTPAELASPFRGCIRSGVPDLGTNPKYMEGFGAWKK